jgi:hypothetical protein
MLGGLLTLISRINRLLGSRSSHSSVRTRLAVVMMLAVLTIILASCAGNGANNENGSDLTPTVIGNGSSISATSLNPDSVISPSISTPAATTSAPPAAAASAAATGATTTTAHATTAPVATSAVRATVTVSPLPPSPTPTPPPTAIVEAPLIPGYDLDLQAGDFWRFRWEWADRSCSQGSGCRTSEDDGVFQVSLGESAVNNGVEMFEVISVGESVYADGDITHSFAPEWSYIGINENRIVVSKTVSSKLVTLFDAQTGVWPGSSFFSGRFSDDVLVQAYPGSLSGSHEFATWDGVETGPWDFVRSADTGGECSLFDGRILCPTEEKFDYTQNEYYRPGVGPFGYIYNYSASFSGGGLSSSFATEERVALIASSFTGDVAGDFGKPTPVPPTPTAIPTPTPVVLGDPIYGPVDGSLALVPTAIDIPEFEPGLNLDAGVADVVFGNPDVSGKWSHGISFRNSGDEIFHAVFINSDGEWGHFARGGSLASQITIALGSYSFDRTIGGQNRVTVWFGVVNGATQGIFQINGEDVAVLDLSYSGASAPGDVTVMSGLFPADDFNGESTRFTGFTVYEKP